MSIIPPDFYGRQCIECAWIQHGTPEGKRCRKFNLGVQDTTWACPDYVPNYTVYQTLDCSVPISEKNVKEKCPMCHSVTPPRQFIDALGTGVIWYQCDHCHYTGNPGRSPHEAIKNFLLEGKL